MKRFILLIILLFFVKLPAQSFFNLNGLGEITLPADARYIGLGNPMALTPANPGNFIYLPQTTIKISLTGTGLLARQNTNRRGLGDIRPVGVYGAIPFFHMSRLLFSVDNRFNQDFDIWSEAIADTAYRYHIVNRGGISALNIGLSHSLLNHICIGAQFQQLIGGSRENWHYWAEGIVATDTIEINYTAHNFRLGSAVRFSLFSFNATYDLPLNLTAIRYNHTHGVTADSVRIYQLRLPSTVTVGFSVAPFLNTTFNAGLEIRNWEKVTINESLAGYKNVWRGSIGVETEFIPRHPVRIGYSKSEWYCKCITGEPITESGIHLGTGIPLPKFGALDIGAEVNIRTGKTPVGLLQETIGKLTLTLAYQEFWAKRTRRWGY